MKGQEESKAMNKNSTLSCHHCNEIVIDAIYENEKVFCCHGCHTVHLALESGGLLDYYRVREELGISENLTPENRNREDFSYMNESRFREEFLSTRDNLKHLKLYIEGVHCLACIWLLEKIPSINKEILSSRINMSSSIMELTLVDNCDLELLANQIFNFGYRPHAIKNETEAQNLQKSEEHTKLIKIGVAGACSANIMLYSIAIYAGAGVEFSSLFGWVSFFLSLPVIFYSATPFYKSSISAIRTKSLNIDIPISFAIILGSLFGLYNLIIGSTHYYFDSLSVLVFLLLSSRLLVQKSIQKGLNSNGLSALFEQTSIKRLNKVSNEYEVIHTKYLERGDIVLIDKTKTIPADGVLLDSLAYINNSLITGESRPQKVLKNETVFAGAVNLGEEVKIRVEKTFKDSVLGDIIQKVETDSKSKQRIQSITDKISRYFIATVFTLSLGSFLYFAYFYNLNTAIERTLALIIVSCPCALGLAAPLAVASSMNRATENGIIIKNDSSIEDIARIKNIFFDKTGTLTDGNFSVAKVDNEEQLRLFEKVIYNLEEVSNHPMARALQSWTRDKSQIHIDDIQELPSKGVSGKYEGDFFQIIKSPKKCESFSAVDLVRNNEVIGTFYLSDQIKSHANELLEFLGEQKFNSYILSGDNERAVSQVGASLNIPLGNQVANQTPETKSEFIENFSESIMVGDGANDAIAMKKATVSIAVSGAMDIGLRASDIYLTKAPLKSMIFLIKLAKLTNTSIKLNLLISLIYNAIGVTLSLLGLITPLGAAVLMPVSSLSVLIATIVKIRGVKKS